MRAVSAKKNPIEAAIQPVYMSFPDYVLFEQILDISLLYLHLHRNWVLL